MEDPKQDWEARQKLVLAVLNSKNIPYRSTWRFKKKLEARGGGGGGGGGAGIAGQGTQGSRLQFYGPGIESKNLGYSESPGCRGQSQVSMAGAPGSIKGSEL